MPEVSKATLEEFTEVKSFYSKVGYFAELGKLDTILVALDNFEIVGAVRLCHEADYLVLRGMYVSERERGLGVGAALLLNASNEIGARECWCIPYDHLCCFYGEAGFREVQSNVAPDFLSARATKYLNLGKPVAIMKRSEHWSVFA